MDKYTITYIKNSACNKSSEQLSKIVLFSDFFLLSRSPFLSKKKQKKNLCIISYIRIYSGEKNQFSQPAS